MSMSDLVVLVVVLFMMAVVGGASCGGGGVAVSTEVEQLCPMYCCMVLNSLVHSPH